MEIIYTLAGNRTTDLRRNTSSKIIHGTGTPLNRKDVLLKRANKKVITNAVVLSMIDIAKDNGDNHMIQSYWNTFHCQEKLVSYENRYYTDYCKNRWCSTCCGIRKAHILNKYYPILSKWVEPHLLTLTLKSVKAEQLNERINEVINSFSLILDRCRKRYQRGKGMKIVCVKSLECNFNASKRTYNPHYHIITQNRVTALYLRQEWTKQCNKREFNAGASGQHIRPVANVDRDLVEVIKYGAKILSDPNPSHKRKRSKGDMNGLYIYANALNNIYKALKNHHLYSSVGFKLPESAYDTNEPFLTTNDYKTWRYKPQRMDWISDETGKLFTEFEIDSYLDYILRTKIDKELF